MELKIKSMSMRNFKGIVNQDIEFGGNAMIHAENEGGKTTLFDAFLWVLFGKDSLGQADFELKTACTPRTKSHFPDHKIGEVIPQIAHEVKLVLDVDFVELILEKHLKEQWTKKRGDTVKTFTGHVTDYFINGVPVPQKEYKATISGLIDEDLFRMLADVRQFNSIHWKVRREMVMELAGGIDESKVDGYSLVKDILGARTIDQQKKVVNGQKKKLDEEIERIPVQIDENTRMIIEAVGDGDGLTQLITTKEQEKGAIEDEVKAIKSDGAKTKIRNQVANLETEITEEKNSLSNEIRVNVEQMDKAADGLRNEKRATQDVLDRTAGDIKLKGDEILSADRLLKEARASWTMLANQQDEVEDHCPTCKQSLPREDVKKVIEEFNLNRANGLDKFKKAGLAAADKKEKLEADIAELKDTDTSESKKKIEGLTAEIDLHETYRKAESERTVDVKEIEYKIDALKEKLKEGVVDTSEQENAIRSLDSEVATAKKTILDINKNKEFRARIEELQQTEKKLSTELAKLEGDLDKLDQFTISKVHHIEEKINDMFEIARFKMFHQQVNGGLDDVCETMKDGVPYNSVNNAGKIQVGVDIIKALQKHHKLKVPIWIDNRESVTELPETDCQIISLFVSPEDKTMRIENGN